jgi:hypothetical protein
MYEAILKKKGYQYYRDSDGMFRIGDVSDQGLHKAISVETMDGMVVGGKP